MKAKLNRVISVIMSLLLLFFIIFIFFAIITPEIVDSVMLLSESIDGYLIALDRILNNLAFEFRSNKELIDWITNSIESTIQSGIV